MMMSSDIVQEKVPGRKPKKSMGDKEKDNFASLQ